MNKAQLRRQTALGMISELYLPTPRDEVPDPESIRPVYLINGYAARYATGEEIADNIVKLRPLGRTERWDHAITYWAASVRRAEKLSEIRHAFLQGIIYANHASI